MTKINDTFPVTQIQRVVDGDTYWLRVDLGFRDDRHLVEVRLLGYDTPESNRGSGFEKSQAQAAKAYATTWLQNGLSTSGGLWIKSRKDPEKYGRWLCEVWRETAGGARTLLGEDLCHLDLAVPSDGTRKWRATYDVGGAPLDVTP